MKQFQDLLYEKSGQGVSFTGLLEAMVSEVTIVTAVHNIKSNKGSKTAGVDRMKMDKYRQSWMPRRYAKSRNIVKNSKSEIYKCAVFVRVQMQ